MPDSSEKHCIQTRKQVIAFLLLFTSPQCLQGLGRLLSPARVAFELSRIWFEEIYVPSRRYLTSLKGDFSEEDAERFWNCFSVEEYDRLERFHRFFELRVDMLSEEQRRNRSFPINQSWHNLQRDAGYLIAELEPRYRQRQEEFERRAAQLLQAPGELPPDGFFHALLSGRSGSGQQGPPTGTAG